MELVKFVYTRNNLLSEPVKGLTFQDEWTQLFSNVGFFNDGEDCDRKVAGKLNLDQNCKEFLQLKMSFSQDQLSCEGVNIDIPNQQVLVPDTKGLSQSDDTVELTTFKMQKKEMEKRARDNVARRSTQAFFRLVFSPEQSSQLPITIKSSKPQIRTNLGLVFIVQVFRPVSADEKFNLRKFQNMPKKLDHVIAVLGKQSLTVLRDKIICCSDNIVFGEFSDNPKLLLKSKQAKDVFKSAFFYIGNTFYNDLRDEMCTDYSSVIMKFSQESNRNLGEFYSKTMNDVKFEDLHIRLGYPYLYLHQGDCEHIVVFSDIRLLDPYESQHLEQFPLICRIAPRHRLVCMICKTFTARWVTTENKRLSYDPYFFCDSCFHSFNYTVEGNKIGDFKAYSYVDRTTI